MLLSLFCYVRGESHKNVFLVKIEDGDTVDGLRKAIKTEKSPSFNDIDASSLFLWKVSLPYSQNIKEDVERHLVGKKPLDPVDDISDLFPLPLEKRTVYVVIDRPAVGTQQDLSGENPAEKAHQKLIHDAKDAPAPSSVSNSAAIFLQEQIVHPIHNGRPITNHGPPLSIYHEAFAVIQTAVQNLNAVGDDEEETRVDNTAKLCLVATDIYEDEAARLQAVHPFIEKVLGTEIERNVKSSRKGKQTTEDGLVSQRVRGSEKKGIVCHVEWKNELGLSGQCGLQNALALRKRLIEPEYDWIRDATCCPCITISIAGPYISFGGAIFADIFVAEQFTDFIYLGGTQRKILDLSRLLAAVSNGISILKRYYSELPPRDQPDSTRLFPRPTYLSGKYLPPPTLAFSGRFNCQERKAGNYRQSIFEASYEGKKVLVKFCESYNGEAHRALADAGYAPTLFFCEKLRGGMMMIVMELVDGKDAHEYFLHNNLPSDILTQVERAVGILHSRNLVFGDLRRPNIVIKKSEKGELRALLIDFEWVGIADQARYPSSLNDSGVIAWANGVLPHRLMKKEHDLDMIRLLNITVSIRED
ncbi:hypothetical protein AGABI1DRAFT_109310 [Agaricus bisporus var. burnettii JB137-S8]|uniref:Protein kinase domain-containing protein n=1 Tax=Agaricus bisporus var. burnettii (strain JB137-S8 / ATCC MYA-4627 / FGSC 10392) TaxID=597362 RepID=K5XLX5_AGABU|nr:uncharacterized protein AGABI1DRAFT_109310 [Agaricus bisporus var. burnettii JB137-S8]EKM75545.1 hypothetical protein AGABI1DRAFT_109310 [Agaricus bisporus var. burnettii JB137-S8]